jgi:16S rRNA (guanine966-N2)-methyltransferase
LFKKEDLKPSCKIYLEYSKYNDIEIPKGFIVLKEKDVGDVKALLLVKDEN